MGEYQVLSFGRRDTEPVTLCRTYNRRLALELRDHLEDQARKLKEPYTYMVYRDGDERWTEWSTDEGED